MNPRKWLVVDLDGTILNIRPRHYAAHLRVTTELGLTPLQPTPYWRIKRSARLVTAAYEDRRDEYDRQFLGCIEAPELLELDRPLPHAVQWLIKAQTFGFRIMIATHRQYVDRTRWQVEQLAIPHDRLVTASGSKAAAVAAIIDTPAVAWIGDTEADIEAARALGVLAVAVTSGLRSTSVLSRYKPDRLLASLYRLHIPASKVSRAPTSWFGE